MIIRLQIAIASFATLFWLGCKGCDGEPPAARRSEAAEPTDADRINVRLDARKIDRGKTYPKDEQGRVTCETDAECLIIQAEGCQKAELTHLLTVAAYGIEQRVSARYRIEGKEGDRCKVVREVLNLEMIVPPMTQEALRKRPGGEQTIAKLENDGLDRLREQYPERQQCLLSPERAVLMALDLADGKDGLARSRADCTAIAAPPSTLPTTPGEPAAPAAER